MSNTQRERRDLLTIDRGAIKLEYNFSISSRTPTRCGKYLGDTPVEITLEVGRNFHGRQVINVAKLVSQCTSKGDCASYDSTTFAIGDTFLARSTRIACEDDVRPDEILVGRPAIRVSVEFALQLMCQYAHICPSTATHQEDMDEEGTLNGILPAAQVSHVIN